MDSGSNSSSSVNTDQIQRNILSIEHQPQSSPSICPTDDLLQNIQKNIIVSDSPTSTSSPSNISLCVDGKEGGLIHVFVTHKITS